MWPELLICKYRKFGGKKSAAIPEIAYRRFGQLYDTIRNVLQEKCGQSLKVQSESKKSPPEDLWQYFQNGCEFFNQILHAYYAFLSTLDCILLFKYLQV